MLLSFVHDPLPGDPHGEGEWLLNSEEGGRDNRETSVELSAREHYSQSGKFKINGVKEHQNMRIRKDSF